MRSETYASVWDALCDTQEVSANMKARSALLSAIVARVQSWDLPPDQAATRLGLTPPRLDDMMQGKIQKFSLDALMNIARTAGITARVDLSKSAS